MMAPRGAALADRPEHALLVGCARSVVAAHQAATEWPRGESLDWAYLIAQADRHGVLPLLAGVIASWEASSLPQEPLDELRRRMLALAAHNLSLSVSLRQLVDLLESHAIPVVPFKGPALAVAAFGDVAHRQFDDLDVLVPRKDLQRAIDLLQGAGHRLLNPRLGQQLGAMLRHDKHVLFEHRPSGTLIEVHWALAPRHFGLPLNERLIWESAHRVTVAGRPMRAVPPDVLLLMLCIHGARHEWRRLSWIVDVAALGHRCPDLPWTRLRVEARRIGAERLVHLGLGLAHRVLHMPLPDDVRCAISADRVCGDLQDGILRDLFVSPPRPSDSFSRAAFHWRSRERPADRCRCMLGWLLEPNTNDLNVIELPATLSWLYYGVRPFRLAASHFRRG